MPAVPGLDRKLARVSFPYTSSEVLSGCVLAFVLFAAMGALALFVPLLSYILFFAAFMVSLGAYVFATQIEYSQRIIGLRDEMLRAVLEMSNYISLNTSMEYAFVETGKNVSGTLGMQLREIMARLAKKEFATLGEAIEHYIPRWLEISPDFVKALNLLQTAHLSPEGDKAELLDEVVETVILSYHEQGKRSSEILFSKTQQLISFGVLFPTISLILLPLVAIFFPPISQHVGLLAFLYVVFIPVFLIVITMNFATHRVQINTVRLEDSAFYRKKPPWVFPVAAALAALFSIPAVLHLTSIDLSTAAGAAAEFGFEALFNVWLMLFGLVAAVALYTYYSYKTNEKLWLEVDRIEREIPNMLQIFSSYLSQNRSVESVIQDVREDYVRHGFGSHPLVRLLGKVQNCIFRMKKSLREVSDNYLYRLVPSKRFIQVFQKIVMFSEIDQRIAAKSAKRIRKQTLSVYDLDNYVQSFLAETVSVVSSSVTFLAPILSTAAIIMAISIVMALEFIKQEINSILGVIGATSIDLALVDISQIIPPTVLEAIIGLYFIETAIILSVFLANIRHGASNYYISKSVFSNVIFAFLVFSLLLFVGLFFFREVVFSGVGIGP